MTGRLDTGSFRDPRGRVYLVDQRVFRTVMPMAVDDYEFVRDSGFYQNLVASGRLVDLKEISTDVLSDAAGDVPGDAPRDAQYVLEHPMLPFFSNP